MIETQYDYDAGRQRQDDPVEQASTRFLPAIAYDLGRKKWFDYGDRTETFFASTEREVDVSEAGEMIRASVVRAGEWGRAVEIRHEIQDKLQGHRSRLRSWTSRGFKAGAMKDRLSDDKPARGQGKLILEKAYSMALKGTREEIKYLELVCDSMGWAQNPEPEMQVA